MINFVWILVLLYVFQSPASFHAARTNNDELRRCLSSSLPLSTRTIYPCNTLTNQNSQCDSFDISRLSSNFGGRLSHSPAVVVYAMNSSDVQNVVKCATKLDYIVNALSGGHSYEGYGLGSTYNNIIINMEAINYIDINTNDRIGIFGAGARLGRIYYKSYQYDQYTITAGVCPWVGLAGHALGGGYGFLSRSHGLLSDHILEMKAVTAEGELLTINKTHEPDLYWALRGSGGGMFVIVTEFQIQLVRSPPVVTTFLAIWSSNIAELVLQQYQSLLFNNTLLNLNHNLDLAMFLNSVAIEILLVNFDTDLESFNQIISIVLSTLPTPNSVNRIEEDWLTFVYRYSWIDNGNGTPQLLLLENATYPTGPFKAKYLFYDQPISSHSLEQLVAQLALNKSGYSIEFKLWDGYLNTMPVDQTAFPHRQFKFSIQFMIFSNNQQERDWLNQIYLSVYNDSTKYSYINYIDRDVPNWMDVYYHTHQQRLINVKEIYDKDNRFYFERTVESSRGHRKTFFKFFLVSFVIFISFIK